LKNQKKGFKLARVDGLRVYNPYLKPVTTNVSYIALSDTPIRVEEKDVLQEHIPAVKLPRGMHDIVPTKLDDIIAVTIEIPQALKDTIPISNKTRETLLWYLSVSKDWDVNDRKGIEAVYRNRSCYYLTIRFSPPTGSRDGPPPSSIPATKKTIRLDLNKRPQYTMDFGHYSFSSYLHLDLLNDLWIYIHDGGPHTSRENTLKALDFVATLINDSSKGIVVAEIEAIAKTNPAAIAKGIVVDRPRGWFDIPADMPATVPDAESDSIPAVDDPKPANRWLYILIPLCFFPIFYFLRRRQKTG
jgi:hypothetical protein